MIQRNGKTTQGTLPDPVLQFMRHMWEVDHELQSASKRMEVTIGLTGPQRLALLLIGRRPGLSAGELAALLHLHPGTLTGVLKRLDSAGCIVRERAREDGRRMELTLTERGRAANRNRGGTVEAAVRKTLSRLTPGERKAAQRWLTLMAAQLRMLARNSRGSAARGSTARGNTARGNTARAQAGRANPARANGARGLADGGGRTARGRRATG